jgi:hypothetical protein
MPIKERTSMEKQPDLESLPELLAAWRAAGRDVKAAEAAKIILATAEGDKVRADLDIEEAGRIEAERSRRFHETQDRKFEKDPG